MALLKLFSTVVGPSCCGQCQINRASHLVIPIRWKMKPWDFRSPKKLYKVQETCLQIEEDIRDWKKEYDHYKTQMRGIRKYYIDVWKEKLEKEKAQSERWMGVDEEFQMRIQENERVNREIAEKREARMAEMLKSRCVSRLAAVEKRREQEALKREEIEEFVRKEKELAKGFVTSDNVELAIDRCLSSEPPVLEFSVDGEGRVYGGKDNNHKVTHHLRTSHDNSDEQQHQSQQQQHQSQQQQRQDQRRRRTA